jgi:hypothetical protein
MTEVVMRNLYKTVKVLMLAAPENNNQLSAAS